MLYACVQQTHRKIRAALTCGDNLEALEVLELDVPQPGEVLSVGDLAVGGNDQPVCAAVDHA